MAATVAQPLRHGWYGTYTNQGCRCRECKDAWATYQRESYYRRKRAQGYVKVEPLQLFLQGQVQALGIGNVASACGVSARRIDAVIRGYYMKDGKRCDVRRVELATADEWCVALGEQLSFLYPPR